MYAVAIVSPTNAENYKEDAFKHPCGTGPFKFVDWIKDDHITLEANEDYWGEKPKLDKLIFKVIPDPSVRLMALEVDEIQGMEYPNPSDFNRIKTNPQLKLLTGLGMNIGYMAINTGYGYKDDDKNGVRDPNEPWVKTSGYFEPLTKKKVLGLKVFKLFEEVDKFQKRTQKSRRIIRKQASVVPFAPAKIIIRTFGSIEVIVNNNTLKISDWKTQTSRDLFLLFLAYPEGLTKEEVGVIFWPDASPSELKLRFKNAIYRMRHAIGSDVVNFQDNYYLFNRMVDYEYDVQNFIAAIKKASANNNINQKIEAYEIAVSLYKGTYLPHLDETWVVTDREKYLKMYIKAAEELALLYMNNNEFETSLETSQSALEFDPYYEPLHRICMKVYAALGNKSAVLNQFDKCRKILLKDIGTEPSDQTIALYKSLINE